MFSAMQSPAVMDRRLPWLQPLHYRQSSDTDNNDVCVKMEASPPQIHSLAGCLHAPAPHWRARLLSSGFTRTPFTAAAGASLPWFSAADPTSLRLCVPAVIQARPVQMLPTRSPLSQHQHHCSVNSAARRGRQSNQPIRCQVLVTTANQCTALPGPTS